MQANVCKTIWKRVAALFVCVCENYLKVIRRLIRENIYERYRSAKGEQRNSERSESRCFHSDRTRQLKAISDAEGSLGRIIDLEKTETAIA